MFASGDMKKWVIALLKSCEVAEIIIEDIKVALNAIKNNYNRFPFVLTKTLAFTMFFSYDFFYYFHKCLGMLKEKNCIDKDFFEKFINIIKNNNAS